MSDPFLRYLRYARKKESPIYFNLMGSQNNFNFWGERSISEYLLLKRGFSTYTR